MGAIKALYCSRGHKMAPPNLYMKANGQRECRACSLRRSTAFQIALRTSKPRQPRKGRNSA